MINIVRRSQIIGLVALDGSTGSHLGETEEVWLDEGGRVTYLSDGSRYLPLEQVFVVDPDAILTYSSTLVDAPVYLRRLHRLAVESTSREPLGWIEDFVFDWQMGEIAAYILSGAIADSCGGSVILDPEDVVAIEADAVVIRESAKKRLKTEAEGLKGFLSEKSQAVKNLVKTISDRLHGIVSPEDRSDAVRIKIKQVSDELASSSKYEPDALLEATEFLQERWSSLQQNIACASSRAKAALDAAWKELTAK